jgi:hypothetical protein
MKLEASAKEARKNGQRLLARHVADVIDVTELKAVKGGVAATYKGGEEGGIRIFEDSCTDPIKL